MSEIQEGIVQPHTRLINVLTEEYGITLQDLKRKHRDVMWGTMVTEDFIASIGFAVVHPRAPATSDEYLEITPVNEGGKYYQAWRILELDAAQIEVRLYNAKETAKAQISNMADSALARGFSFNFGTEAEPNIKHIQVRDLDRVNILGIVAKSEREPEMIHALRTYENTFVQADFDKVHALSDQAYDAYLAIKQAEWTFRDQTDNASTIEVIPALPTSLEDFYTNFANLTWVQTA